MLRPVCSVSQNTECIFIAFLFSTDFVRVLYFLGSFFISMCIVLSIASFDVAATRRTREGSEVTISTIGKYF